MIFFHFNFLKCIQNTCEGIQGVSEEGACWINQRISPRELCAFSPSCRAWFKFQFLLLFSLFQRRLGWQRYIAFFTFPRFLINCHFPCTLALNPNNAQPAPVKTQHHHHHHHLSPSQRWKFGEIVCKRVKKDPSFLGKLKSQNHA